MYVDFLTREKYLTPWMCFLKNILDNCGLSNIWCDIESLQFNIKWIKVTVNQRLKDQFLQKWHNDIFESSKGVIYRIYKTNFQCEHYLTLLPKKLSKILVKVRTTNHHLPVEVGRWSNVHRNERYCNLCNCNKIGDEFHYILECKVLCKIRSQFLSKEFCSAPNTKKFCDIMSSNNSVTLRKLCIFILKINQILCSPDLLSV